MIHFSVPKYFSLLSEFLCISVHPFPAVGHMSQESLFENFVKMGGDSGEMMRLIAETLVNI